MRTHDRVEIKVSQNMYHLAIKHVCAHHRSYPKGTRREGPSVIQGCWSPIIFFFAFSSSFKATLYY